MELGDAETLGVLDDHYRGVGDVDADFDDGGGDEDLDFVFAELLHDFVFLFAGEPAMQEAQLHFRKDFLRETLVFFHGGFQLDLGFFYYRINDVGLMASCDFAADAVPDAGEMRLGGKVRFDGRAAGWEFVEDGNVEIAVESERESAGDGRGGKDENVGGVAVGRGFVHQTLALEDAETVLFIDGDKAEAGKLDVIFDESVRADNELRFAGADALESGGFFSGFQTADKKLDAIAASLEDVARGKKMLDRENFCGGHERGLASVFDGDDRGLQGDDSFAAADVALEKAVHGRGLFEVGSDFGEDALLGGSGLERENALESLANIFFAEAESDGVFFKGGAAVEGQTELIEEKFLEDEALLGGGAEFVQGVDGFFRRGEMRLREGLKARWIAETRAEVFWQNIGHARV